MKRRLIAITLALAAWVTGTVAGSFGTVPQAAGAPILEIGRAHADYAPVLTSDQPIFILLLGSDSRPGTAMIHGRSDSIHILGINPAKRRATLLGIPRDSWVSISTGGTNKINSAMSSGGPEAAVATVESLTGIKMDYYAVTGFSGLIHAVDQIGGVMVDVPYFIAGYERNFEPGLHRLDGGEALGFARTRHSLPRGDFDRSENQGILMMGALAQFRDEFAKDPSRIFSWLGAGLRNVSTTLSIDELLTLGFTATKVPPDRVTNLVVPGTTGNVGGLSVVFISAGAQALYNDLGADGFILPNKVPS